MVKSNISFCGIYLDKFRNGINRAGINYGRIYEFQCNRLFIKKYKDCILSEQRELYAFFRRSGYLAAGRVKREAMEDEDGWIPRGLFLT